MPNTGSCSSTRGLLVSAYQYHSYKVIHFKLETANVISIDDSTKPDGVYYIHVPRAFGTLRPDQIFQLKRISFITLSNSGLNINFTKNEPQVPGYHVLQDKSWDTRP